MIANRPKFEEIKNYEEFSKYYYYREELKQICKNLGIDYSGTKQELNNNIKEYFSGNKVKKKTNKAKINNNEELGLDTPLLNCGFCFNQRFREYFSKITGVKNFKFNADMAASWKRVKQEMDEKFTIKDMLEIYYGKLSYAKYDNSECKWNKFLKDFCSDEESKNYDNKLKVASILWKEVRDSTDEKVYKRELIEKFENKIKEYRKK